MTVNIKPRILAYRPNNNNNNSIHTNVVSGDNNNIMMNMNDASAPQFDSDIIDTTDQGYYHQQQHHYNDVDDDDDNEKGSKIKRTSREFFAKSIMGLLLLFVATVALQSYADQQQQQQQQQNSNNNNSVLSVRKKSLFTTTTSSEAEAAAQSFQERDTQLATIVKDLDQKVRARKATKGVIMETDPEGVKLTIALQQATLALLKHRYSGSGPFRIRVDIKYPNSIQKSDTRNDHFVIETAPISLVPCSVFYFLEMARTYVKGGFHRNAPHVLQAHASSAATAHHTSMPFQEYHPDFPHKQYTVGYAGRPSGPGWYVSIQDNTDNHGPGTQQKQNPYEADSLFGKLVPHHTTTDTTTTDGGTQQQQQHDFHTVVQTIHSVPQHGWLDPHNEIAITKLTILHQQPNNDNDKNEWVPLTFLSDDLLLVMQH
ncbi:hypothetical protein IV203_025089 [Nitzschia inconspicua]|uniref:Uncharacterized protein n=1 Tax=Nitzschia inconspicua TaxID=303405 RepID=A0A9K3LNN5_9STRA|nr:hypothetical protein IV203_025166 [Nitzschia inconspicua]KAG7365648.1 hypothetical protein IV203_025089 [Nitzschia inconspicua]